MLTSREIYDLIRKKAEISFDAPTGHQQGFADFFEGGWDNDEGRDMFGITPSIPDGDGYLFYVDEVSNVEIVKPDNKVATA